MTGAAKKIFLAVLIIVAAFAVYFVFVKPAQPEQAEVTEMQAPSEENTSVYLTSLTDLAGNPVKMDENKVSFVNVWATWCGPCNMEMPGIQTLYDRYKENPNVEFYIISDEDAGTVNPFIARKGYKLPFYRYTEAYPAALDGNAIPRTYIIHKGRILTQEIGASQWDRPEIRTLIDKQLSEL